MVVSLKNIQDEVLKPFQNHRQLSIKESETLTLDLLALLCDDEIENGNTLKYLAKLITPTTYDDLIEERNLNHLCGYPLCNRPPERNVHHSESTLHHGNTGVMSSHQNDAIIKRFLWENNPYAYLSKFCSKFHFRCSQFYQVQLDENALFSRTGIHLINDTLKNKENNENENENTAYQVTLFEDLLREKSTEEDVKSLIIGLKKLGLHNSSGETELSEDKLLEDELSQWLSDIKIVENNNPPLMGDLEKEN
ncbi:similar to Saccharomyces cerevisiae YER139C RTR1 CTD phosphatase [Maudiozyma saulgeensis]|uniref:RNA polymerase II subunit B1 CTD phosphatase RPAP2 homolog n=1 Tax=Maudiozyma saulgeensis TaxID=1789683 RepID=A0A1X7R7V6_9SACH|nr:similar to Saccharomyces cerevisiae YER139C RTR1 CTD phosphatase [Kazachstania saulgeensis]